MEGKCIKSRCIKNVIPNRASGKLPDTGDIIVHGNSNLISMKFELSPIGHSFVVEAGKVSD